MSIDRSLRGANTLVRHRNVLNRVERLEKLKDEEKWTEARTIVAILLLTGGTVLAQQAPVPATQAATRVAIRPYTAHTYADAVRELHERGYPVTMIDLQSPSVPDDQNAAILLKKAAAMFIEDDPSPRSSSIEYGPGLPYDQKWFELAEQSMVTHAELLKTVRQARSCPSVVWDKAIPATPTDWMSATLSGLSAQRALANTVADAALLEHFKGNDAAALEYARDLVSIADANARRPLYISHLVAVGMRAMSAETLLLIATDLRITDARKPSGAINGQGATRQQCTAMVASLLDDAFLREEWRRVMLEERVYALNALHAGGQLAPPQGKPMLPQQQTLPQYLEWFDCAAAGVSTNHLTQLATNPLSQVAITSYAKEREHERNIRMYRAAAAIAMAARMYAEDHGAYPADLKDLVPDYLSRLPSDPYSPTTAPLLYRPGKRPMLGTAGPDGKDAHLPPPARPSYNLSRPKPGEPDDQWFDLTAWR